MSDAENQQESGSKNKRHRKEKPWDTEDIDKWHIQPFTKEDMPNPLLEESSFSILFPKYKEQYLKEFWPQITGTLKQHGIACQLDLVKGTMGVSTTSETVDPYIIFKARDLIKLLARSVPFQQAKKVLQDDTNCDIIKIGNLVRNKERFVKRRQRLLGPNGNTLKAIELLTECYVMVQGNTVSVMGSYKGLKECRRIITDCMNNIHPIYHIKTLMIKRELMKDEKLKYENWDRFLPKFKKQNQKSKKAVIKKKDRSLAPEQTPRKIDLMIESGEYFLSQKDKKKKDIERKKEKQDTKAEEKVLERQKQFIAPAENTVDSIRTPKDNKEPASSMEELKQKFIEKGKKRKRTEREVDTFLDKPVQK